MSKRYPGGIITKSPATPTGPFQSGTAPGIWTLEQQMQFNQQGVWPTAGLLPNFIEDVFSTYLYTGTSAVQTITNNIDLSTYGGLVWIKNRSDAIGFNHVLQDSVRGFTTGKKLASNLTTEQGGTNITDDFGYVSGATSTGFTLNKSGTGPYDWFQTNASANNYVSWTFREQPKFFDVVTYTGTGSNTTIAHSLGSVPGSIIVKRTDTAAAWAVYHRSLANTQYLVLNTTAAAATGATWWNSTTPTSSVFSVGTDASVNASGGTYVAYLFAHDAGGFGTAGTDNVISCGSVTTDGSGVGNVTLGYEPQWILTKQSGTTGSWRINDSMRGLSVTTGADLRPNLSSAETDYGPGASYVTPNATGFSINSLFGTSQPVIYIAIRRGPMKVPTLGTTVYKANTYTGNATANTTVAGNFGFPVDLLLLSSRDATATAWASYGQFALDRLRGGDVSFATALTDADIAGWTNYQSINVENSIGWGLYGSASNSTFLNNSGGTWVANAFRRASSVFDIVCYTGTGVARTVTHNLTVVPELIIVKRRDIAGAWDSYCSALANTEYVVLNTTAAKATGATRWNSTTPTSSVFSVGTSTTTNASAGTYVAYLFATCAGVSKVGSYTGTGTTKQIDCGFTAGARFVLIKRTDSTGDWYVWDSARGIVAGNDPYLLLNSTAAEVTSTDYIDTYSAGFEISSTAPAAINASAGTFIFLAIA